MTAKQREALEGATVRIYHLRPAEGGSVLRSVRHLRELGLAPSTKGGITRVVVEWPDGSSSSTSARCSSRDNYNKGIGRMIAVGRAIKLREWAMSGETA